LLLLGRMLLMGCTCCCWRLAAGSTAGGVALMRPLEVCMHVCLTLDRRRDVLPSQELDAQRPGWDAAIAEENPPQHHDAVVLHGLTRPVLQVLAHLPAAALG
jgi:hypothetical protein